MNITLDQLLAAEVPSFDTQRQAILNALDAVVTSVLLKSYSSSVTVQPAAEQLRAWLISFRESMQAPKLRLEGSMKTRVCFAENGMKLLLAYTETTLVTLQKLRNLVQTLEDSQRSTTTTQRGAERKRTMEREEEDSVPLRDARAAIGLLRNSLLDVLGKQQGQDISFLQEWFSYLVHVVPTHLKSIDTSLTVKNDNFLSQASKL